MSEVIQDTTVADEFIDAFENDAPTEFEEESEEPTAETEETETEETEETAEQTEETQDNTEANSEEPAVYTVKINGKEQEFTLEQLKAEAGRSVARQEKLDKVTANTEKLSEIARAHGMSVADLISQMDDSLKAVEFETKRQEYIDKGYDEEVAEQLANKDIEIDRARNENKAPEPSAEEVKAQRDIEMFTKVYPDVDLNDVPQEVFADIEQTGMTLTEAYQKYEIAKIKADALKKEQEAENKKKAVGSARTKKAEEHDAFLDEFLR